MRFFLLEKEAGTGADVRVTRAGNYALVLYGVFNGASVHLEYLTANGFEWDIVPNTTVTQAVRRPLLIEKDAYVRAVVTSPGAGTLITARLEFIS